MYNDNVTFGRKVGTGMNNRYRSASGDKQGFTIIEVVLVLAIAGLIFLMVFVALPALQRGQRDAQRRNDLSRINTQLNNYQGSTRGKIPASSSQLDAFVVGYLDGTSDGYAGNEYVDPNGPNNDAPASDSGYEIIYNDNSTISSPRNAAVYYTDGQICAEDGSGKTTSSGASARNYALRIKLESQNVLYCVDSN